MKRVLVGIVALLLGMSALVTGGPYFGVENVGIVAAPEVVIGADIGGLIGVSGWTFDADGWYTNPDLLVLGDPWMLDLVLVLGWTQTASINQTGMLTYGCEFTIDQSGEFGPGAYPQKVEMISRSTGLTAEGFVGPLSVWFGCEFPWLNGKWLDMIPTVGFLVSW